MPAVRAGQLVVAEFAAAAVVVAAFGPGWVIIGVSSLAAAVLVATFGRAGGRWWYEAVASQRRFRRRRKLAADQVLAAAVAGSDGPPHVPWLRTLAPTFALRSIRVGTATVGVGTDHDGWFAAVEVGSFWDDDVLLELVRPSRSLLAARTSPVPPGELALGELALGEVALGELAALAQPGSDRAAVSCVQVILVPGASPDLPQPAWVAVRVTPADALATELAGGVAAVERVVAAAAVRAARILDGHGWPARAAGLEGLLAVLVESTGLDGPPQEHWSVWRSGRISRTHFEISGWTPGHGTLALGVTQVAVCYTRRGERHVLAAVAAQPALLAQLCRGVVRAGAQRGVRLWRLDGEQALAAYATAATAAPPASGRPSRDQRFRDNHERAGGGATATEAGRLSTGSAV